MKLKIKGLPKYADPDHILLYAAFTCLERYVLEECGGAVSMSSVSKSDSKAERKATRRHNKIAATADELYNWWLERRKIFEYPPLDNRQWQEDTRQLKRLIKIRGSLWT
jgi:hypothetical protein